MLEIIDKNNDAPGFKCVTDSAKTGPYREIIFYGGFSFPAVKLFFVVGFSFLIAGLFFVFPFGLFGLYIDNLSADRLCGFASDGCQRFDGYV